MLKYAKNLGTMLKDKNLGALVHILNQKVMGAVSEPIK